MCVVKCGLFLEASNNKKYNANILFIVIKEPVKNLVKTITRVFILLVYRQFTIKVN